MSFHFIHVSMRYIFVLVNNNYDKWTLILNKTKPVFVAALSLF